MFHSRLSRNSNIFAKFLITNIITTIITWILFPSLKLADIEKEERAGINILGR